MSGEGSNIWQLFNNNFVVHDISNFHSGEESNRRQLPTEVLELPTEVFLHLLKTELCEFCRSDSLSEEGLRQMIERQGWEPNNNLNNGCNFNYFFFLEACGNERVTEGIIQCLLEYFPHAASANKGLTPLHIVCGNKNVTLNIVQLLIDEAPNSVRMEDSDGWMPLHYLCGNENVDEMTAIHLLRVLIEKHPEAVRHVDYDECLPIHLAAKAAKSPAFCRVLTDEYPASVRNEDLLGKLPLHYACWDNTVATVEYLYKLYPNAINDADDSDGKYPIHYAIDGLRGRDNPAAAVDIVKFLLDCDPNIVKLQKLHETKSLLYCACQMRYDDSNIEAGIQVIKVIYDAYPEAIEDDEIASYIHRYHQRVQTFINSQLDYSRQANDHRLMTTPDESGQLPLHRALRKNVPLGSITMLVKGYPPAVQSPDNSGALPLHFACAHHESASVIHYLLGLDETTLDAVDRVGNTALHYACLGAKYETIALLLDKYDAVPVSKRNVFEKLPIHLLLESDRVEDRENIEYIESIFRLLRAYPEPIVNYNPKQQAKEKREFDDGNETGESADECSSRSSVGY